MRDLAQKFRASAAQFWRRALARTEAGRSRSNPGVTQKLPPIAEIVARAGKDSAAQD